MLRKESACLLTAKKGGKAHNGQYAWKPKFLISFLNIAENSNISSSDQPSPLWNNLISIPSRLFNRLCCSQAPTSFSRLSRGHGLHGSLKMRSVTFSKPRSSNHPFQRIGSSTGVPKLLQAVMRLSDIAWKWESEGTLSSSHWRTPVTQWNSAQPPGLRCLGRRVSSLCSLETGNHRV